MTAQNSFALLEVPSGPLQVFQSPAVAQNVHAPNQATLKSQHSLKFSLIIPTYNEGRNIQDIVRLLSDLLDQAIPGEYELIVVDDNSPDKTWEIAQNLMPEYPQLRVMRRQLERGLSSAVIRGWQAARGEILGVIDADLQHPPEVLLKLLNAVEQGADLAVASRHVEGGGVSEWSLARRFLSRGAQTLGLILLPGVIGRVSDPMSGYFMVRRSSIADRTLYPLGYKILIEVLGRGDIERIAEVGYVFQERQQGESKVTAKQYIEYLHHLTRLRIAGGRLGRIQQRFEIPLGRLVRFGLVGLSGVFVDMTLLYLLSDPSTLGLPLNMGKSIAAEVAILNNFLWNDAWTFADLSSSQKGMQKRLKRFLKFNFICLAGLVLNLLTFDVLIYLLGINPYLANLIAIAIVTIWNFWLNLKLSWRITEVK